MENKGQAFFEAASRLGNRLRGAFALADNNAAKDAARFAGIAGKTDKADLDAVVASAGRFLYFADADTVTGRKNLEVAAGFSGSVASVILGSSAPNYDTGMGSSAGKEDEEKKKRQEEWDRLFMLQQQLAQRLQEIDWQIEKLDEKIHDTKKHMSDLDREKAELEEMRRLYDDHLSGRKKLEVGADGKLKNEKVEKALQEFERRTGKKIDRNNQEELKAALRGIKLDAEERLQEMEEERKHCEENLERFYKEREGLTTEKKTTEEKLEETTTKMHEAKTHVAESTYSSDKTAQAAASSGFQEVKEMAENKSKNRFADLNKRNHIEVASNPETPADEAAIALNVSAASSMDEKNSEPSLKNSFKVAHGETQQPEIPDTEVTAQNKNPVVKPLS